jgi:hypothetical protein
MPNLLWCSKDPGLSSSAPVFPLNRGDRYFNKWPDEWQAFADLPMAVSG